MKTINFRNAVQAALFTCELRGQISDGYWENSTPHDHWKVWSTASISVDPKNVGINFYPSRKYNFNRKDLVDIVGYRMLNICNMAENNLPLEIIDQFNDWNPTCNYSGEYWNKKRAEFKKFFGTVENFQKARTGSYDYKKLRSELKDMSDIIKTTNSRFKSLLTY
jgi:hypothetical protein